MNDPDASHRCPVLVTGGAGYIGSHVVLALKAVGWPVVVLDNLSRGVVRPLHRGCVVVQGDVGDTALVRTTLRRHDVGAVIHLAASTVVPDSVRAPLRYYHNNLTASVTLLAACVEHGIRAFVFSSTAAVYGNPPSGPVDESTPPAPISPYGRSKRVVEQVLADLDCAQPFPHVILRYFNVAGADPLLRAGQVPGGANHLIRVACEAALGRRAGVPVYGCDYPTPDGTCVRDFVHVSDLAEAHVAALRHLLATGRSVTLNCGYGRGFSVRQVIAAVERAAGVRLAAIPAERRPGDPVAVVAATERIRQELDWKPRFDDLDRIVGHALAWEQGLAAAAA